VSDEEIDRVAQAWRDYWIADAGSDSEVRASLSWATDRAFDLVYDDNGSEDLWRMILAVHRKDHSIQIQQVLSAGPLEDLLVKFGDFFIERVEREARLDPKFAKLLGGVWKRTMADSIWARVQAVWDRLGWDGIPE
jgi:hypothetical protein